MPKNYKVQHKPERDEKLKTKKIQELKGELKKQSREISRLQKKLTSYEGKEDYEAAIDEGPTAKRAPVIVCACTGCYSINVKSSGYFRACQDCGRKWVVK